MRNTIDKKWDSRLLFFILLIELMIVNITHRSDVYKVLVFTVFHDSRSYFLIEETIIPSIIRAICFSILIYLHVLKQYKEIGLETNNIIKVKLFLALVLVLFTGQMLIPPLPLGFILSLIFSVFILCNCFNKQTGNKKVQLSSLATKENILMFFGVILLSALVFFTIIYFRSLIHLNLRWGDLDLYNKTDNNYILIIFDVVFVIIKSMIYFFVISKTNILCDRYRKNPSDNKAFTQGANQEV